MLYVNKKCDYVTPTLFVHGTNFNFNFDEVFNQVMKLFEQPHFYKIIEDTHIIERIKQLSAFIFFLSVNINISIYLL